jgi:hypothetical protein
MSNEWDRSMANPAESRLNQSAALAPPPSHPLAEYHPPSWLSRDRQSRSLVDISPPEIVKRRSAAWSGLRVETVRVLQHTPFEYGFRAPCHLLIAAEVAERYDGESFVEGLARSTLRDFTHKRVRPVSTSIRTGLLPIPRSGSARSNSSRACSFTIAICGRPLSSSSRWSKTPARCNGNMPKRSASC